MKKFFIKTAGCKTNMYESALMAEMLVNAGFCEANQLEDADYYILNSCSVTHIADSKNLSLLRHARRENPSAKIVITGCMAQLEKEKLIESGVADIVIGNNEKKDIAKILESSEKCVVSDIFSHQTFCHTTLNVSNRTRAAVKIQDGCNNRCSYCTIPFARGKNRSDSEENILSQINLFADEGYYEAVLTGIHIGQWGFDLTPKKTLLNLLQTLEKSKIGRYRTGSLNPTELSTEFCDFLAASKKFCPHFHLSLQSLCDKTLKNMNRHYTYEKIKNLVGYINLKLPNAFIGCDIIVGFPGESNEDFNTTLENAKTLGLSRIHVFPYSRRKGTVADSMPEQIPTEEKKRRVKALQAVSDDKLNVFFTKNINLEHEVVIEKQRDKKTGLLKGVTENYIAVLTDGGDEYKDTVQTVVLTGIVDNSERMYGRIIAK